MFRRSIFLFALWFFANCSQAQISEELKVKSIINNTLENKDALLKDYYELNNETGLLTRGSRTVYKDENLIAIQFPVGGIDTGNIQYDGQAVPRYWQIFNNSGHDFMPNRFLQFVLNKMKRLR